MSVEQLRKAIGSFAKLIENSEKIALPVFAAKLSKMSEAHPEDKTIGIMADVVSRMNDTNKLLITKAEIKDLYNKLYTRNTKFAQLFSEELGNESKEEGVYIPTGAQESEDYSVVQKAYDKIADPVLANALAGAFGNDTKPYTASVANSAKIICARELTSLNLKYKNIDIVDGREDFILCSALFETPRGNTAVYIPVEVTGQKALIPSVFIGNAGPEEFSLKNIVQYITKNAGNKLTVKSADVIKTIISIKDGDSKEISNIDLAVTKLNAQKEANGEYFTSNQVLFQKTALEDENLVVQTPEYKDADVDSFAKNFDSEQGTASFTFSPEKVNAGRDVIARKLLGFGVKNSQISVLSSDKTTVIYAVSVNGGTSSFRVPVKISKRVNEPELFIVNGSINSFTQQEILNAISNSEVDSKAVVVTSSHYGLKPSELVTAVKEAVSENNYVKAEDALNVLADCDDEKAYQSAFTAYSNGLNTANVVKEAECKCSRIVKNAYSKYDLCGHTNLPLHKVYQDKNGNCHPMYRKSMEETQEGAATFMNAKILL